MSFISEFKEFIRKNQVMGLAIAFIIGASATKLVTAIVTDLVMPIIGAVIPGGQWRTTIFQIGDVKFLIGDFTGALIDFLIIVLVIFLIVKFIINEEAAKK